MKQVLLAAAAVLALTGCMKGGGDINHGGTVTLPGGASLSKQVPANLPDYVKVYQGATVTAVMDTPGKGGVLALAVNDPPETVLTYYKQVAADAKLTDAMDSWALSPNEPHTGAHVIMFSQPGTHRSLSVSAEVKEGHTQIGLIYGPAA